MSNVNNISANSPLQGSERLTPRSRSDVSGPAAPVSTPGGTDEATFSSAARRLSALNSNENTVRPEIVERIREEIANGNYLNEQKLDAAADVLIDRLEQGL